MPAPSIPGVSRELVEEWDELADRVGAAPFSRPGWIGSWVAGFGGGPVEVFTVRRGPRLSAVVGLQRSRGCLRSPTNAETPLFCPVAEDETAQADLAAKVAAARPSRLVLGYLPAEGSALAVWRTSFGANGYRTVCRKVLSSPYLPLSSGQCQGAAVGSAKQRQELRRRRRRLEEQGPVDFDVRDGRQGLSELLEEAFRLEASGWKAEQGTAIAARRQTRRFPSRPA